MRLGFLGTGAIAEALIVGMIEHGGFDGEVRISRRSERRSSALSSRFSNVEVLDENQAIVKKSDWVFIAVLPKQAERLIGELDFRADQILISLVAGNTVNQIKKLVAPCQTIHRIIPLPPIERGVGPLPIYPANPQLAAFFDRFGTTVEVEDESHFSTFSAASAVMATHHRFTATVAKWIEEQGVPDKAATVYASQMLNSLTDLERSANHDELQEMAQECLTVGGLNEQVLNELEENNWFEQLTERLDRIADRLG